MKQSLIETYIKNTKNFVKDFTKVFFEREYNEEFSNLYIDAYINARIYNEADNDQRYFYKRIAAKLEEVEDVIKSDYKHVDVKFLKRIEGMYEFIYYADGLRKITDLKEFSKEIAKIRKEKLECSPTRGIETKLYKIMKEYIDKKDKMLEDVKSDDFTLNIQKYILIDNTYKVDLTYNFKIPYIYSQEIIEEVYHEGTINEDKLIIEYTMLVATCIDDINKGLFEKTYVVDFAATLFQKKNKLNQVLRMLDNDILLDKIVLRLKYVDFINNKEFIYELMKEGYKFAIIINDEFNPTLTELRKLDMFEFLIVPIRSENYEVIREIESKISNEVLFE